MTTPTVDFAALGPAVGSRFPEVALKDQHGRPVDLHAAAREGRRAIVVFYRSALW